MNAIAGFIKVAADASARGTYFFQRSRIGFSRRVYGSRSGRARIKDCRAMPLSRTYSRTAGQIRERERIQCRNRPQFLSGTLQRAEAMSRLPIADYGLVSDCHSAALISRMGSVDWLCFPRFDAPSIFGRLLDDKAGHCLFILQSNAQRRVDTSIKPWF